MVVTAILSLFTMAMAAHHTADAELTEMPGTALSDSSRVYDIDEVVVVAQPKEVFHLRQQPLSASSIDDEQLRAYGVQDLRELSAYVPSFTMPNYGSRYTSSMYIRGIGSRVNSPAIGIYVDGIPLQSKSAFNFHTYDVSRIDVLRGPQGTLYGMNTEGGLVRLYSKNPFQYQGTDVTLSAGSHFWRKAEAAHYQKLSDRVAFALSGFYDGQNGFFRNQYNGERADDFNEAGGKLRLLIRPTDRLTLSLIGDYQYVDQNGFPYGLYDRSSQKTAAPNTNEQGRYRRNVFNGAFDLNYHGEGYDVSWTSTYQYLADRMLMDIDYSPLNAMVMEQKQLKNGLTQELAVKSNGSRRWQWTFGAFASFDFLNTWAPIHFYDESFTSTVAESIQTAMYNAMVSSMAGRFTAQGMTMDQARAMAAATIERAGGVSIDCTLDIPGQFRTPTYNLAVFHESNLRLTDRLTATLGLRYDYSQARIEFDTQAEMDFIANVMGTPATYAFTSHLQNRYHKGFDQFLPKVGLTWQLDRRGSNVYAVVSKGYRAGGYNLQSFGDYLRAELEIPEYKNQAMRGDFDIPHDADSYDLISRTISFKPEESWNYELGTHLNLFSGAMQLDLATFYMQIKNQQLSVMAGNYGFGRMMVNAGKSYSCGLEAAVRGKALNNRLAYNLSYSYTNAQFKEYLDEVTADDGTVQTVDYKDNHVPFIPEHTFAAQADYALLAPRSTLHTSHSTLHALHSITIGVNVNGQGKTYWDEANIASDKLYAVLGAHANFSFKLGTHHPSSCPSVLPTESTHHPSPITLDINLWGRNLTNTNYNPFVFAYTDPGKTYFGQRGAPIQFGADLKLHF